jgi:predicted nuclease of predicted toxin-antitoxin system
VKLWFDEDLSPTLVKTANERGLAATCNRDRGVLGHKDRQLRQLVQGEGYVLVTDNASDFRPMYGRDEIHPGLIVMPGGDGRARQQELLCAVIKWIVSAATNAGQTPADFMVNTLVEIDSTGRSTAQELPRAS